MASSSEAPHSGVISRLQARLPALTGASRAIADQVLDDPATALNGSIGELARLSGTSPASVTRLCHSIGLTGFSEFKLCLAGDLARPTGTQWEPGLGSSIGPEDPPGRVVTVVSNAAAEAVRLTVAQLDERHVVTAARAIARADRCDIFGVGGSAIVTQEAQLRLHAIGRPTWAYADVHQAKAGAALLGSASVSIGISRSGRTREVVESLEAARERGATTIALTSYPRSPLAAAAAVCLTTPAHDVAIRHGSFAARYSQLIVLDCVYSVVGQLTYDESTAALAAATQLLAPHRLGGKARGQRTTSPPGRKAIP